MKKYIVLFMAILSYQVISSMESTEKIDYRRTFLKFNKTYHFLLAQLPIFDDVELKASRENFYKNHPWLYDKTIPSQMPNLENIEKEAELATDMHDVDKYKKAVQSFISALENCKNHAQHSQNGLYIRGREELVFNGERMLDYIKNIEEKLTPEQFALNDALIKTIKKQPNNLDYIKELLSKGASPNSRDVLTGHTALTLTITTFNLDAFNLLLTHKADVKLPADDKENNKPFYTPSDIIAHEKKLSQEECIGNIVFLPNDNRKLIDIIEDLSSVLYIECTIKSDSIKEEEAVACLKEKIKHLNSHTQKVRTLIKMEAALLKTENDLK